ncbi:MAG: hypothetical protein KAG56_11500 [Sulfurovaceae bacterium]|nr:hypothetical protein [Sulfurovaceae bacterium]
MPSMKEGVRNMIYASLDTKDELFHNFIEAGFSQNDALKASTVAVKSSVENMLENNLAKKDAATITNRLKEESYKYQIKH